MILANPTLSDYVVKSVQQDYITAAEHHRLAKKVSAGQQRSTRFSALRQRWFAVARWFEGARASRTSQPTTAASR
jgi:hypothetical protein